MKSPELSVLYLLGDFSGIIDENLMSTVVNLVYVYITSLVVDLECKKTCEGSSFH